MTLVETMFRYYVDRPGRDLSPCRPGAKVYIDIEPGCFTDPQEVRDEGTRLTKAGFKVGIYTNQTSFEPVFGASPECAEWGCPLWVASWDVIPYAHFRSFNGWTQPELWQYSNKGIAGINADLNSDPEGRLFADISNYTTLTPYEAWVLRTHCQGVVIGLQNTAIARMQSDLLSLK